MLVRWWHKGTKAEFWIQFSNNAGNHMAYSHIISSLAERQKEKDIELVEKAKDEYSDQFKQIFTYRKGDSICIKVKPCEIAKQYRALHGLKDVDND